MSNNQAKERIVAVKANLRATIQLAVPCKRRQSKATQVTLPMSQDEMMWSFFKNPQGLAAKGKILMFLYRAFGFWAPSYHSPKNVYTNMFYIYISVCGNVFFLYTHFGYFKKDGSYLAFSPDMQDGRHHIPEHAHLQRNSSQPLGQINRLRVQQR